MQLFLVVLFVYRKMGIKKKSILREEKGQWWENIGCKINCKSIFDPASRVKSLTSLLTSQDVADTAYLLL